MVDVLSASLAHLEAPKNSFQNATSQDVWPNVCKSNLEFSAGHGFK
jgi:hypothetical protein